MNQILNTILWLRKCLTRILERLDPDYDPTNWFSYDEYVDFHEDNDDDLKEYIKGIPHQ